MYSLHRDDQQPILTTQNPRSKQQEWAYAEPKGVAKIKDQDHLTGTLKRSLNNTYNLIGKMLFGLNSLDGSASVREVRGHLHNHMSPKTARRHLIELEDLGLVGWAKGTLFLQLFLTSNATGRKRRDEEAKKHKKAIRSSERRAEAKEQKGSFSLFESAQMAENTQSSKKSVTLIKQAGFDRLGRRLKPVQVIEITQAEIDAVEAELLDAERNCFQDKKIKSSQKTLPPMPLEAPKVDLLPAQVDPIATHPEESPSSDRFDDLSADAEDVDDDDSEAIRALMRRDIGARRSPSSPLMPLEASLISTPDVADLTALQPAQRPVMGTERVPLSRELGEADFAHLQNEHPELAEMRWGLFKQGRPQLLSTLAAIKGVKHKPDHQKAGAIKYGEAQYRSGAWKAFCIDPAWAL